jgi:ParB-like nuclease domain
MATTVQKITLSPSRDIPFNKLLLSQSNVRRVKAGVSVEELAEDIARRGLLQGLSVRPVTDQAGVETGMFEIPAGGRRYRALKLLVKQKRLAKTAPVPASGRHHREFRGRPRRHNERQFRLPASAARHAPHLQGSTIGRDRSLGARYAVGLRHEV